MKLPNNYGSITKLSGNRRKPYMVRLSQNKHSDSRNILGYYTTKEEALAELAKYNNNPLAVLESNSTVDELWELIKDTIKKSEDRKKVYNTTYTKYIKPISTMKIKDVKKIHIQNLIDNCGYGYSTKSNIRTVLKHIFKYAIENDLIDKNYTDYLEIESEATHLQRVLFNTDEIKELWEHVGDTNYDMCLILLYQGMRIKELRDCKKDWIDLDKKTIDIKIGKNAQSLRIVPIHDKVFPIIKRLYDSSPDNQLLHSSKGSYDYFVSSVLSHLPYDTRHTFASKANEIGIQKVTVQRLMGHKPKSILEQTYIHLSIEELSVALNTIDYI